MATAQQYNLALRGYAPLVRWVEAHVAALHAPPGLHEVAVTNGGNHTVEVRTGRCTAQQDVLVFCRGFR